MVTVPWVWHLGGCGVSIIYNVINCTSSDIIVQKKTIPNEAQCHDTWNSLVINITSINFTSASHCNS